MSDTLFFWLSKLAWAIASPSSVLVILVILGWLLLMKGKPGPAKLCFTSLFIAMTCITTLPIGQWLLIPLESRFTTNPNLPASVDGIVVLSGPESVPKSIYWQQVEVGPAVERHLAFIKLAKQFPAAKLVFTGGSGSLSKQPLVQADIAEQLFNELGMDSDRVIYEKKSRNTAENATLSYQLVKPKKGDTWLLITTAWHMPRSIGLFCQSGWPMLPYPVDHYTVPDSGFVLEWDFAKNLNDLDMAAKEWLGLLAYYAAGKTPEILPSTCLPADL